MKTIKELFNVENELLKDYLNNYTYPVEILPNLHDDIIKIGHHLGNDYHMIKENVWVHESATIKEGVEIIGPAIIMAHANLKHYCYIRENVIIGEDCVIGNSSEIKNSIVIGKSNLPHFNYVGDSIIGSHVNLGAGSVVSNLRFDKKNVRVEKEETSLRKIGAFIGDNTEIGVNSVVCPGTVVMPNSCVFPLTMVKHLVEGVQKEDTISIKRL